jgi:hypothetical protein
MSQRHSLSLSKSLLLKVFPRSFEIFSANVFNEYAAICVVAIAIVQQQQQQLIK